MVKLAHLTAIIEPEVKALGFDLVRVKMFSLSEVGDEEHTLQVMAENPLTGQLLLDECAALSRRISDRIDALEDAGEVLIREAYRLEVSSPGIDRPLTRLKDFSGWVGHEAKLRLFDAIDGNRKNLQGVLAGVDGETILLDDRKSGRVSFMFSGVESAHLVLTDRLLAVAKPLDMSGAEEFDEQTDGDVNSSTLQED